MPVNYGKADGIRSSGPRLGSVCSGVGGMDMGLEAAGFSLAWLCEKDAQCRTVLGRHWPDVPIYPDLEGLADRDDLEPVQLLAGGTPCQDLSVAGRRAGLDGARSGLFFAFIRLADRLAPDWVLWENVDGALSSEQGEDFAVCLEGFTGFRPQVPEDGWRSSGVCVGPLRWCVWRCVDAQYFGVAQRRARLFVVAGTGTEPRPEILLEPDSVSGDSAPRREAGEDVARPLGAGTEGGSYRNDLDHGALIAHALTGEYVPEISPALKSRDAKGPSSDGDGDGAPIVAFGWAKSSHQSMRCDETTDPLKSPPNGQPAVLAVNMAQITSKANCSKPTPEAPPLDTTGNVAILAPTLRVGGREQGAGSSYDNTPVVLAFRTDQEPEVSGIEVTGTIDGGSPSGSGQIQSVFSPQVVPRRLTPVECERLMGWPDDHTRYGVTPKGKVVELKDSPRYRMIGNGVVKTVARWIGERIVRLGQ